MMNTRSCELCIFQHTEDPNWQLLGVMPTICLFALQSQLPAPILTAMIKGCLAVGAVWFATFGEVANIVEEQIDFILETGDDNWLSIATTSHQDESIEDMVNFLTRAAYCEAKHFRCLIVFDQSIANGDVLLKSFGEVCSLTEQQK